MTKLLKQSVRISLLAFAASALIGLVGCGAPAPTTEELWQAAMADAVFSQDDEVRELVNLTPEDERVIWDEAGQRVLLLSWHDYDDPCAPGDAIRREFGEIWCTSLGEVAEWYGANGDDVDDWNLRFAQLLGVHADEGYTRFTAFWVSPEDVIRPAYTTDVTAEVVNDYTAVTGAYKSWFDSNILWSYFESDYPWTRLGYTYDWSGGASEYGLTEFLVSDSSGTEISFTYTTDEFVLWLESQLN